MVWLADSETLILKDRREVEYTHDREAHKKVKEFNDFVIKLDKNSVFF